LEDSNCGERIKAYENWTQARRDTAHLLLGDWHSPGSRTALSSKLFVFREAGTQVSPVTMSRPSLRASAPPCLLLFIKEPLKEDLSFFGGLWLDSFDLGFLVWEGFWKGKELLKGNC
jgi:hypothetical protein